MEILELLVLLFAANGAPVLARKLFGERFAWPVDGGLKFLDGRPLFGASKTVRGLFFSLLLTSLVAVLLGQGWLLGLVVACASMGGDLLSSFIKRRFGVPVSGRATGLDQVPESLFPALACQRMLDLDAGEISLVVMLFLAGDVLLSPLFYRLRLRRRPY